VKSTVDDDDNKRKTYLLLDKLACTVCVANILHCIGKCFHSKNVKTSTTLCTTDIWRDSKM